MQPLGRRAAPDVPAGERRALLEAELVRVAKAPGEVLGRARWLWQGPAPGGRLPVARGDDLLLFLAPAGSGAIAGAGAETAPGRALGPDWRLANAAGQQRWSPALEASLEAILAEARLADTPRSLPAISHGFHVKGTVAGESESQLFLESDRGRPVALVLLRRPGAEPELRAASGDLIDESAAPVRPRTLLWRALACTAPERLPPALAADEGLAADWAEIRRQIGPCDRTL